MHELRSDISCEQISASLRGTLHLLPCVKTDDTCSRFLRIAMQSD